MQGEVCVENTSYPCHLEVRMFGKGVLELVPPLILGHRREEVGLRDHICSTNEGGGRRRGVKRSEMSGE